MGREPVLIYGRLRMLASLVTPGNRVADVGCDHGFLPIWLVQNGVIPGALAMDVRRGPLEAAREHIEACGLGDYIELRCSDGLAAYRAGEAKTLVCAGMGGRLMQRILAQDMGKARGFGELILQPQSQLREFRAFLREEGFEILREEAVCEDGKDYFAMKAAYAGKSTDVQGGGGAGMQKAKEQALYDSFGEKLLLGRNPVLRDYLLHQREILRGLVEGLLPEKGERVKERRREVESELDLLKGALAFYKGEP